MLKLKLRSKLMTTLAVLFIGATLISSYFILKSLPDKLIEVPVFGLFAVQLFVPIVFTAIFYQVGSKAQKIRVASLMIALAFLFAAVGNMAYPQMRMFGDIVILLNWLEIIVTLLGSILATLLLYRLAPASVYAEEVAATGGEDKKAKKEREKSEKQKAKILGKEPVHDALRNTGNQKLNFERTQLAAGTPESKNTEATLSNSATNLRSVLDSFDQEDSDAPADKNSSLPPEEPKPAISNTGTRLQAQKRDTSTFAKLQALSASGTGALRRSEGGGIADDEGAESLKSILDRLDGTSDESDLTPLFNETLLSSRSDIPALPEASPPQSTSTTANQDPSSSAIKSGGMSSPPGSRVNLPASVAAAAKSAAMKGDAGPAETEVPHTAAAGAPTGQGTSAAAPAASASTSEWTTDLNGPSLSEMLDSIATPSVLQKAEAESASQETSGLGATPLGKAASGKKLEIKLGSTAAKSETDESAPAAANMPVVEARQPQPSAPPAADAGVFGSRIDREVDDIFATLVPAEAQREVHAGESADSPQPDLAAASEIAAHPAAAEAMRVSGREPAPDAGSGNVPAQPAPAEAGVLFASAIDKEVDDIFSNLVPAEAQKEVTSRTTESISLAETSLPAEFNEESMPATESPAITSAPQMVPSSESQDKFIKPEIDKELDDIFSNLVPADSQKKVTEETLAKLKSSAQEEMSFAPPAEADTDLANISEPAEGSGRFVDTLDKVPAVDSNVGGRHMRSTHGEADQTIESFAPPAGGSSRLNKKHQIWCLAALRHRKHRASLRRAPEPTTKLNTVPVLHLQHQLRQSPRPLTVRNSKVKIIRNRPLPVDRLAGCRPKRSKSSGACQQKQRRWIRQ